MTTIDTARVELAGLLNGLPVEVSGVPVEVPAYSPIPDVIAPPLVHVGADAPYITLPDANFGEVRVNLAAACIATPGVNEATALQLDAMVREAVRRIVDSPFRLDQVDEPVLIGINNQEYPGVIIRVFTFASIT